MVKIRLTRTGKRNYATYRVVVSNAREKRESDFIEYLGHYNPNTKEISIDKDRSLYWLSVGAQPTDTVKYLLEKQEIVKSDKKKFVKKFSDKPGKKTKDRSSK